MKCHCPLFATALMLVACSSSDSQRVEPERFDRFWLWAGVNAPEGLQGREWYLLDGEVRGPGRGRFTPLRPGIPNLPSSEVWLVVRTDTLNWPKGGSDAIWRRADSWAKAGTRVVGIQLDFDADTSGLGDYARFLAEFRHRLPYRYKLSITGLLDWSANGNPAALAKLGGLVDEVVIQTYQGRETIPGYELYFERMRSFPIPFKVGLVEGGQWIEPEALGRERHFKGYVVFLVNGSPPIAKAGQLGARHEPMMSGRGITSVGPDTASIEARPAVEDPGLLGKRSLSRLQWTR